MARLKHKTIAIMLNVPISTVAIIREVIAGSSAAATRALQQAGNEVDAARLLAKQRNCPAAARAIHDYVIKAIREVDCDGHLS